MTRVWTEFVTDSIADHPASPETDHTTDTTLILVTVAAALTGLRFTKDATPGWWLERVLVSDPALSGLMWWGLMSAVWYLIPAMMVIRLFLGRPLSGFGLGVGGVLSHWRLYVVMLGVMIPLVWAVSATDHFQAVYPFYRPALSWGFGWRFGVWWVAYALQFVSLEFFFRGFMVHGLRPHLGFASIGVMMVPYTMIHFAKPPLETVAAILAGLALGAVSLRTRSIWLGAALHIAVAFTMDLMSMWRVGAL